MVAVEVGSSLVFGIDYKCKGGNLGMQNSGERICQKRRTQPATFEAFVDSQSSHSYGRHRRVARELFADLLWQVA